MNVTSLIRSFCFSYVLIEKKVSYTIYSIYIFIYIYYNYDMRCNLFSGIHFCFEGDQSVNQERSFHATFKECIF